MDEKEPGRGGPGVPLATVKELRGRRGKGWLGCQVKELGSSLVVQAPHRVQVYGILLMTWKDHAGGHVY